MRYLANAFSLQMLSSNKMSDIRIKKITKERAINILKSKRSRVDDKLHIVFDDSTVKSTIGHEELTKFLTCELGTEVPYNRVGLNLRPEDSIVVAQITGGRVNEDTGISFDTIAYFLVEMKADWHAYFYKDNKLVLCEDFKSMTKTDAYKKLNSYLLNSKIKNYDDLDFTYTI